MNRISAVTAIVVLLAAGGDAMAGPFRGRRRGAASPQAVAPVAQCENGSCQEAAEAMAASGVLMHRGNPTRTYEGIGFATSSPQDALARCCFSGSGMTVVDSGVARGDRGWFAVKRYAP
jgi:hypothetical protein